MQIDAEKEWNRPNDHAKKYHNAWVVTNMGGSEDAAQQGKSKNTNIIGWVYPKSKGLKDWFDASGLLRISWLTKLVRKKNFYYGYEKCLM